MPHQIQLVNMYQFSQNTCKPPHKNDEVHQQMIPVFLKHAAKIGIKVIRKKPIVINEE